ncbi:DUF4013 domain-containing protein [Halomarina halobia]|uniref:DUF4013 domain-containing protein n=1 Tax=Halomarina halobia TaxID=3033386 RepID=A0ABD6A4M7_9EURY|nr:DUF4013 domain-containing protein [Halomarina sp. PSR21]
MITEALTYLRRSDSAVRTVLIGTVLSFLSFLVIPAFLVAGYTVRVVRAALTDDEPPVFDEWRNLFTDGLKAFLIGVGYFAIPVVFVVVAVGADLVVANVSGLAGGILGAILAVVGIVLVLALWYVFPVGLARFARTGRMGSAFQFSEIRPVALTSTYAVAWLLALVVGVAAGSVSNLLFDLSLLGVQVLLGLAITFYAGVVTAYLYGRGVGEATPIEPAPEEPTGRPAA